MPAVARSQERADERRAALVEMLRQRGNMAVADLPNVFGVSAETIRRDLRVLEDRREVTRAYGSVRAVESGTFETNREERTTRNAEEKLRIARVAAQRIGTAETIFIDEGYLPLVVAREFPQNRKLTIVTSSLPTACELAKLPHLTVIAVGGRVRASTLGVVDPWSVSMLESMELDLAIVGANGVTEKGWLTTPDPAVAGTKRAAMAAARRRIFVGDHSKFGQSTFVRFGRLADVECAITGHEMREATARRYSLLGTEIVRA